MSFRFVVSKHRIKRRKRMSFPREHDNGNLDDFKAFRYPGHRCFVFSVKAIFENNEIKIGNFNYIWSSYNKKNITRRLKDMNFMFSWQKRHLTSSLRSLVRYRFCHSNIKFISSRHRVISSIYMTRQLRLDSLFP